MVHRLSIDAVFDIECESWDQYVVGAIKTVHGVKLYDYQHERSLIEAILAVRGNVWSHFGGRYDMLWFLQMFRECSCREPDSQIRILLAGSKIIAIDLGTVVLRDSFALIPLSLAKAAGMTNVRKLETDLPCICNRPACKGYCSIARDMPRDLYRRLERYLIGDVEALWAVLHTVFEYAVEHHIILKPTIGASAWATARQDCNIGSAKWWSDKAHKGDARVYKLAQKADYGGRVQCLQIGVVEGIQLDVNALYPFSLTKTAVPLDAREELIGADARRAYDKGLEGTFHAIVNVPKQFLPVLPYRSKERLLYPYGRFSGHWTGLELRYAESCGTRIEAIGRALVWRISAPVYRPFCERIWKLRDEAGTDSALGRWLKEFSNSATGKLGQKPERREFVLTDEGGIENLCHASDVCGKLVKGRPRCGEVCCLHRCSKRCGSWWPLTTDMELWSKSVYRIPACGHVHHAAYLKSFARSYWHRHAMMVVERLAYGDTDSLKLSGLQLPKGFAISEHEIGAFKHEANFRGFYGPAPKTYIQENTWHYKGRIGFEAKSKGIPEALDNWHRIMSRALNVGESGPVAAAQLDSGVDSFLTAVRSASLFQRKATTRQLHLTPDSAGDRIVGSDGRTYPRRIDE